MKKNSLQVLECEDWGDPPGKGYTYLVNRCHELHRLPLAQFTVEDMRRMIGQQIGLLYLIPLAIETLELDIFAEGHLYYGDLLESVLKVNHDFWMANHDLWLEIDALINTKLDEIHEADISTEKFYSAKRG